MPEITAHVALVLHAHLPYVRHPEHEDPLEERWLFEAVVECYLPLLDVLEGWERDGLDYRLTLSLSPPLLAMLADPLLRERTARHLRRRVELAERELTRTRWLPQFAPLARHYHERMARALEAYEGRWGRDLAAAFAGFAAGGRLELITSSATHAFLPLLQHEPRAVRAQIGIGLDAAREAFGLRPRGIWSPECGYYPGLDQTLVEEGIGYTILDAHALLQARRAPRRGVFWPVRTPAGLVVFGRDIESSREVWSGHVGYPGDPWYREFYRDIGYDLEYDYILPYIHESGRRMDTGFKYHRVTGRVNLADKQPYEPERAAERVQAHAEDFLEKRRAQAERLRPWLDRPPLITAPYDAELFGHWWYEGPQWLDAVMRRLAQPDGEVRPTTPGAWLAGHVETLEEVAPQYSSWGMGGYAETWLDASNAWLYPRLHRATREMVALAGEHAGRAEETTRRVLAQMARELLLAQSSDWAFILRTGTVAEYARKRIEGHLEAFEKLCREVKQGAVDPHELARLEQATPIFPRLDVGRFAGGGSEGGR